MDWLVDDIDGAGLVDEYIVISNHKFAHHFEQWAQGRAQKVTVVDDGTSTNETRLGAVCDVQYAIGSLQLDDDMLVIAGDNLLDFSLQTFVSYAAGKGTSCIMRFYEPDEERLHKCGIVRVADDDRIISMEEKPANPQSHWACPPFYFYAREHARLVSRAISDGCGTDAPGSFIAWLAQQTPVYNEQERDTLLQHIINPYKGNLLYLDFWGMGCGPCLAGMLTQREIIKKYQE